MIQYQKTICVYPQYDKPKYIITNYVLGKGCFATTKLGCLIQNEKFLVAVKVVNTINLIADIKCEEQKKKRLERALIELQKQLQIWKEVNHINVVRFYDYCITKNNVYFISELCTGGDLDSVKRKNPVLDEQDSIIIFKQLIDGVKHLYDLGIYHRDLKPSNILLEGNIVKIADFGFA